MTFLCFVSTPHGMEQWLQFRCPGERAVYLRETNRRYPGSWCQLREVADDCAVRPEDQAWVRKVFATV